MERVNFISKRLKGLGGCGEVLRGIGIPVVLKISKKRKINHDTYIFRLSFSDDSQELGLPIGQHIKIHLKTKSGEEIVRSYTPITRVDKPGYLDLLVKIYRPSSKYPQGGKMTQILESLPVNSMLPISGPAGRQKYLGNGTFSFLELNFTRRFKRLSFIAGGTGITPFYQLIKHISEDKNDSTVISILYANRSENDILLKTELDHLSRSGHIKLRYTIDAKEDSSPWDGYLGYINVNMIKETLFAPGLDNAVMYCGPPMMADHVKILLDKCQYPSENIFKY